DFFLVRKYCGPWSDGRSDEYGTPQIGRKSAISCHVFCLIDGHIPSVARLCALSALRIIFHGRSFICDDDAEFKYQYLHSDTYHVCLPRTYHVLLCHGIPRHISYWKFVDGCDCGTDRPQKYVVSDGKCGRADRLKLLRVLEITY